MNCVLWTVHLSGLLTLYGKVADHIFASLSEGHDDDDIQYTAGACQLVNLALFLLFLVI